MPVIQIPFGKSPSNVSIARGIATQATVDTPSPVPPPKDPAQTSDRENPVAELASHAMATLQSIDRRLSTLNHRAAADDEAFRTQLVATAIQISKEALSSDDDLIEKRVSHYAEILLREMKPDRDAVFFVHPRCVPVLNAWINESDHPSIEIQPDPTVEPGDCRLESNDHGLLAALESFLHESAKGRKPAGGDN